MASKSVKNMETKFDWSFRVTRIHFQAIHQDIFEKSERFSLEFIVILMFYIIVLSGGVYTILNYDTTTGFHAAISMTGMIQCLIKYIFMDDLRSMIDVVDHIAEIHKKNSAKTAKDYKLCEKYANFAQWATIGMPIIYCTLGIGHQLPAFYDILTKGFIRPSFGIYFPDVNEGDSIDMAAILAMNIMCFFFNVTILCASDVFIYINFSTIPMFSTLIQRQIDDLRNDLLDKKKRSDAELIKKQLVEIIKMQLKYNENVEKIAGGFNRICFAQISTGFFISIFSNFVIAKFHQGHAMSGTVVGIFQILLLCSMGTVVEISSINLLNKISSFEWYLLPQPHAKNYQIWLQHSQQSKILYIAKIKPLNMETSVSIFRAIYSYSTVLYSLI